jgi:murein L,D-transpeptidase YcbB/YkuD
MAASPASSQITATDPPQAAPQQPASPAPAASPSTPASEPAPAPLQPTPAVAETPPPPPVDPLVAEVRRQLAEPAKGNVDRTERAALVAFYGERNEPLIWVTNAGLTAKARHAMAEIAKADDWGLVASAFELPKLAQGEAAATDLASAEIKLDLAVLKYARHARGGRMDPTQLSKHLDQKPTLREPKALLEAMAATDAPGTYLRDLHPKHEQFQRLRQALLKARGGGHHANLSSRRNQKPLRAARRPT